jgi:xanthine dehydrogenase molybdenum-binding subunit
VSDGSLEEGFAEAEVVIEESFSVHRVAPSYMEPENSLARCNPDGTLTVWVSSQKPYEDRKAIASVLGLPVEQVQVISAVIGGAFGGREDSSLSILTALAAWLTHGNVRIVNNRSESFLAHPKRHPAQIHLKIGAKRDGTLTALHGVVHMDTGAYASYGPAVGGLLTEVVPGPYRIPNVHVETNVVYTHSPYSGAMRGFGSPQAHFAIESCLNMLAERLGMDPLALRRKNILHPGDHLYTRVPLNNTALGLEGCLNAAEEVRKWLLQIEPTPGKVSGVGVALGMQTMGLGAKVPDISSHRLEWLPDGRVMIYLGATDLGQGLATVAEQMVAEALDLPFEMVVSQPVDTRISADGGVTCASRMTYLVGNALVAGAARLRECLLDTAAREMHVSRGNVLYERGQVALPNSKRFPAATFARMAAEHGERLRIECSAEFPYPPETTPQHLPIGMPHTKAFFAAQVVRVEVDPELGSVEVKDVVNPAAAEGQVEGGVSMGIGYALYEDMFRKPDGRWVDSFTEYLLPTARDVPENLEVVFLEVPEESGPYGAKGVAEITLVPTAPAIAEAVYNAVHVRVQDLPITPEKLIQF